MADLQKFLQNQASSLSGAGVSIGDTTMILTSLVDLEGNTIAMTDIGDKGFGTIEPNSSDREEIITFTGITQNANGTATITGIKNQIGKAPYTETSGFLKSHPGGVKFVISNTAGFYDNMASKDNDETIVGQYTFTDPKIPAMDAYSIPTDDEQLATKKYVDDTAGGTPLQINRIVVSGTAGATVAAGKVVYLDETDNEWKLADGSASATCDNVQLGIAQGAGTDGNPISGGVLLQGRDTNQSGLAQGDRVYISDTAGTLASSAGTVEVEVGHAISATAIDFQPKYASFTTKNQRDALVGTSGTPSTSNKYVTADERTATPTASKIPLADANASIGGWVGFVFGDGSDGDATIAAPTTLTADKYYNDLTVNDDLDTDGYKVFVRGTLTIADGKKIFNSGGDGGNGGDASSGVGGTAGVAGAVANGNSLPAGEEGKIGGAGQGVPNTAGNAGTAGDSISATLISSNGGAGGAGGASGGGEAGGAGGSAGTSTVSKDLPKNLISAFSLIDVSGTSIAIQRPSAGSGSGGSGGVDNFANAASGGGGGSGATGGVVFVSAKTITLAGSSVWLEAIGGDGGDGGAVFDPGGAGIGGSGGGAGGNGGTIILIYSTKTGSATTSVLAGTGGTGSAKAGTGTAGANGANGSVGVKFEFAI
jgi:hypothetical protein